MTDDDEIRSYTIVNPRAAEAAIDGLTTGEAITLASTLKSDFPGRGIGSITGPEALLALYRTEAIKALQRLVLVDAEDTKAVLLAQNEVARYCETVSSIERFVSIAEDFWKTATEDEREHLEREMGIKPEADGAGYET
jgi:hypothetical protein